MISDGDFPPGGNDDPDHAEPSGSSAVPGEGMRSYPSPSERAWIHPAELPSRINLVQGPADGQPRAWVQRLLAVVALTLLAGGIFLLARPAHRSDAANGVSSAMDSSGLPASLRTQTQSLTGLRITTTAGVTTADAMALSSEGMLFATTAPIPDGSSIVMVDASGKSSAVSVIGSDPGTGISALKTDHVVATRAADVAGCEPGTQVTALAFQPQPDGTVPVAWEPSTIDAVEISTTSNALGVGAVRATATLNVTPGSALIDSRGRIVAFADPTIGANAYLPAILVNAVAQDLIHSIVPAQVHLGITSRNASGSHGAEVVSVSPNSLGAGHLSPGEVVISVGRTTVHNVGDLLNAIYSLPAHSPITLGLLTDNKGHRVAITLPTSP